MARGIIYRHWIVNDKGVVKSYIGQTTNKRPEHRWKKDGRGYTGGDTKFARAIKKYGWNNFTHQILLKIECETKEELIFWLNEWEEYYIWYYNSVNNGYNSLPGGFNHSHCEEVKQKIGNRHYPTGEEHAWYGRHHTVESKQIMREVRMSHQDIYKSEAFRSKISDKTKGSKNPRAKSVICINTGQVFPTAKDGGRWCGVDTVAKGAKGRQKTCGRHPETGEVLYWLYYSDWLALTEDERKLRQKEVEINGNTTYGKKVICIETNEIFPSIASAENKYKHCNIYACVRHKQGTAGGYHWIYYDEWLKSQKNKKISNV